MQSGWRVGSAFGIPLIVDASWFLILAFVTFVYGSSWQAQYPAWGAGIAWGTGLAMALLLFSSVLLHELGHSLVARSQGIQVSSITLFLFGGIAAIDEESKTPGQAFQVAIAGPSVSVILYLLLTLLHQLVALPEPASVLISSIAQINLILALFNMIPGLPLDGGQVLKSAIWKITNNRLKGVRWSARIGQLLGWAAVVLGVAAYFTSGQFNLLWPALLGWFVARNASAYNRVTDLQEALASLDAADAMTRDYRVIDADLSLRQFADNYLLEEVHPPVYFAASDGRYRGMASVEDLRLVERSQWENQTLHQIVHPLTEIPTVEETTSLATVIDQLETQNLSRITVLSPAGAVAGVLDRGDVVRALSNQLKMPVSEEAIKRVKEEGAYPPGLQLQAIAKSIINQDTSE